MRLSIADTLEGAKSLILWKTPARWGVPQFPLSTALGEQRAETAAAPTLAGAELSVARAIVEAHGGRVLAEHP